MAETAVGATQIAKTGRRAAQVQKYRSESPELYDLLRGLEAVRAGDFSVRMALGQDGQIGCMSVLFNDIVAAIEAMARQLERIGKAVGEQGRTRQRAKFANSTGAWGEMETSVNSLIDNLVWPTTEVTRVISAVAQDELLQSVRLDVDGRPLKGEFPSVGRQHEHDDQAALGVHLRGDPRGPRGRHRG